MDDGAARETVSTIKFRAGSNGHQMSVGVASRFSQASAAIAEDGDDTVAKEGDSTAVDFNSGYVLLC